MIRKGSVQKFLQLSPSERGIFPFGRVRKLMAVLRRDSNTQDCTGADEGVQEVNWAVSAARRYSRVQMDYFPHALTTYVLLRRHHFDAELKMGVSRNEADLLEAHAWGVCGGRVIMGILNDLARFTPLEKIDGILL